MPTDNAILDAIFKAYDIRGRDKTELTPEFYFDLGQAYVTVYKPETLAIGHDIRGESVEYTKALIDGILVAGCNVVNLSEISTEMLYFAVGQFSDIFDGGLVVTASHNPVGWNGCKIVGKNAVAIGQVNGLFDLKEIIKKHKFIESTTKGIETKMDIYPAYKQKIRSFLNLKKPLTQKFAVDAGNGIGGKVYEYVFGDLNFNEHKLFFEPDGNFPNHVPNPVKEENIKDLQKCILDNKLDAGIAVDGDADRAVFVDATGRPINGAHMGVLLAKNLFEQNNNHTLVHDARVVLPYFGELSHFKNFKAVQYPAGHSNFTMGVENENALFGAESSAHYYYKDFCHSGSSMVSIALFFNMLSEGLDLSERITYFNANYPISGEINYKVVDPENLIAKITQFYRKSAKNMEHIDGLTANFDNWRFNIRFSNTEPLARLNIESTSKNLIVEHFKELEELIASPRENIPPLLELRNL